MLTNEMMKELTGEAARERNEQRDRNIATVVAQGVPKGHTEEETRESIAAWEVDFDYYDYDWLYVGDWDDWEQIRDRLHELHYYDDGGDDAGSVRYWDRKLDEEPNCPIIQELYEFLFPHWAEPCECPSTIPDYDPMRPDEILTIPGLAMPEADLSLSPYKISVECFDARLEERVATAESDDSDIPRFTIIILDNVANGDLRPEVERWAEYHLPQAHRLFVLIGTSKEIARSDNYAYPVTGYDVWCHGQHCFINYDRSGVEAYFTPEYVRKNGLPTFADIGRGTVAM